jgi:hypothetical protein
LRGRPAFKSKFIKVYCFFEKPYTATFAFGLPRLLRAFFTCEFIHKRRRSIVEASLEPSFGFVSRCFEGVVFIDTSAELSLSRFNPVIQPRQKIDFSDALTSEANNNFSNSVLGNSFLLSAQKYALLAREFC